MRSAKQECQYDCHGRHLGNLSETVLKDLSYSDAQVYREWFIIMSTYRSFNMGYLQKLFLPGYNKKSN